MNVGELLTELRENVLRDASDQIAGASDYLWSDQTLVSYINQAHRRFARKTLCLRDATTPEVCQIKTVVGQSEYTLHKSVIAVMSVRMVGDNADLPRTGHSQLDTYRQPDPYYFDPSQLSNLPPGKAVAYTTDETLARDDKGSWRSIVLRLYPTIAAPYGNIVGNLRVVRQPLCDLVYTNLDAVPEVPEDYHLDMLDWAAYLALRSPDLDVAGGDARGRAKDFRASFQDHVDAALKELQRKTLTQPTWGFGLNGWSYTTY